MEGHNRRAFLKRATTIAIGAGLGGNIAAHAESSAEIRVMVKHDDPLVTRTFALLKDRIDTRVAARVVEANDHPAIILEIDSTLPRETFRIDEYNDAVRVSGGSPQGLLYGVGKFLRTTGYESGLFQASPWRGTSTPRGSLRGMYFATHFHNWYHQASEPEIRRYVEDLALWGVNCFMVVMPMINLTGWDDPDAGAAMEMVRRYAKAAKDLGLLFATGATNAMFSGAPQEIRATRLPDPLGRRGNSGHPICPSNPAGREYILNNTRPLFEKLSDIGLDVLVLWPYDEGGCACDKCLPWGSNGYLRISRDITELGRQFFPGLKTVLSTWMFDTPPEGEWQALACYIPSEGDWINYVLADAHEDFPRYPLDSAVPGNRPLLNFPEISMWGNSPWGGYGANPLPARFQRLWDQVKQKVQGGFPYSEGIYEDMNKAAVAQFYWNPDQSARDTLKEYIAYEFGPGLTEDVLALVDLFEAAASASYRKQPVDKEGVLRACQIVEAADARMPDWAKANWRWELLRLRAILDRERFTGAGLESAAAEQAMLRLVDLYHCQLETDDPYHHRVRPPLKRAVSRRGNL